MNMNILSIDVGIKNLSYCLFQIVTECNTIVILKWGVINLCDKNTKANSVSLVALGINMKTEFDIFDDIKIQKIIIENQIGPLAGRMKSLQGMITQYFIMKNIIDIEFISASNKLKMFSSNNSVKLCYYERKKKSLCVCKQIINIAFADWIAEYERHKKKDDLADCFLQGIYYIHIKKLYLFTFFSEIILDHI